MSSKISKTTQTPEPNEEDIVKYLTNNKDFFNQNPDVLEILNIHHDSGDAVSLIERQVRILREQKESVEVQLTGLIQAARNNEQIVSRMQRFTLEMIHANNIDDVIASCQSLLRSDFKADFVVLKFIGERDHANFIPDKKIDARSFNNLFNKRKPICGRLTANQSEFLFTDNAKDVQSAVLIPLQTTRDIGILALGSLEKSRFTPGVGTLFLSYLGELVTTTSAKFMNEELPAIGRYGK